MLRQELIAGTMDVADGSQLSACVMATTGHSNGTGYKECNASSNPEKGIVVIVTKRIIIIIITRCNYGVGK